MGQIEGWWLLDQLGRIDMNVFDFFGTAEKSDFLLKMIKERS